jgi:hypothetical protein
LVHLALSWILMKAWKRKGGGAAPIRPCSNFWGDNDICLGQNYHFFFCHQMRKSNEICENLGFILVATVTEFSSARLRQPVTIAASESPDFHRFSYSPSSGGRKRNESFPWGRYNHRQKNLPDQLLLHFSFMMKVNLAKLSEFVCPFTHLNLIFWPD